MINLATVVRILIVGFFYWPILCFSAFCFYNQDNKCNKTRFFCFSLCTYLICKSTYQGQMWSWIGCKNMCGCIRSCNYKLSTTVVHECIYRKHIHCLVMLTYQHYIQWELHITFSFGNYWILFYLWLRNDQTTSTVSHFCSCAFRHCSAPLVSYVPSFKSRLTCSFFLIAAPNQCLEKFPGLEHIYIVLQNVSRPDMTSSDIRFQQHSDFTVVKPFRLPAARE